MEKHKNSVEMTPESYSQKRIIKVGNKTYQITNSFSRKHTVATDLETGERFVISSLCFLDDNTVIEERIIEAVAHKEAIKEDNK